MDRIWRKAVAVREERMEPDLEVVQIRRGESFAAWSHGYPYHTVRWHFHPEYEIHLVTATTGRYFVGDFIGEFEPGNLVLTGPNLPHNWVSDIPRGTSIPLRCRIVQFTETFIDNAMKVVPELNVIARLLECSRRGVLFDNATSRAVRPLMAELMQAQGARRISLFTAVLDFLARGENVQLLANPSYIPDPSGYMSAGMNKALGYIGENLTRHFSEVDLAAIAGQSTSTFSRAFRKHTGMSLVQYVKRLRINLACQILMSDGPASITDVCFQAGFNNLSNFNRQFLAEKGMPPSRFRQLLTQNVDSAKAA